MQTIPLGEARWWTLTGEFVFARPVAHREVNSDVNWSISLANIRTFEERQEMLTAWMAEEAKLADWPHLRDAATSPSEVDATTPVVGEEAMGSAEGVSNHYLGSVPGLDPDAILRLDAVLREALAEVDLRQSAVFGCSTPCFIISPAPLDITAGYSCRKSLAHERKPTPPLPQGEDADGPSSFHVAESNALRSIPEDAITSRVVVSPSEPMSPTPLTSNTRAFAEPAGVHFATSTLSRVSTPPLLPRRKALTSPAGTDSDPTIDRGSSDGGCHDHVIRGSSALFQDQALPNAAVPFLPIVHPHVAKAVASQSSVASVGVISTYAESMEVPAGPEEESEPRFPSPSVAVDVEAEYTDTSREGPVELDLDIVSTTLDAHFPSYTCVPPINATAPERMPDSLSLSPRAIAPFQLEQGVGLPPAVISSSSLSNTTPSSLARQAQATSSSAREEMRSQVWHPTVPSSLLRNVLPMAPHPWPDATLCGHPAMTQDISEMSAFVNYGSDASSAPSSSAVNSLLESCRNLTFGTDASVPTSFEHRGGGNLPADEDEERSNAEMNSVSVSDLLCGASFPLPDSTMRDKHSDIPLVNEMSPFVHPASLVASVDASAAPNAVQGDTRAMSPKPSQQLGFNSADTREWNQPARRDGEISAGDKQTSDTESECRASVASDEAAIESDSVEPLRKRPRHESKVAAPVESERCGQERPAKRLRWKEDLCSDESDASAASTEEKARVSHEQTAGGKGQKRKMDEGKRPDETTGRKRAGGTKGKTPKKKEGTKGKKKAGGTNGKKVADEKKGKKKGEGTKGKKKEEGTKRRGTARGVNGAGPPDEAAAPRSRGVVVSAERDFQHFTRLRPDPAGLAKLEDLPKGFRP